VLAEMLRGRVSVSLYEATAKKCAFLAAAAERMQLKVAIHHLRMEDAPALAFDVVTARACAPLPTLLKYAKPFTGPNSVCLFLKGQNVGSELTEAHKSWSMKVRQISSLTDPSSAILELTELVPHESEPEKAPHPGRRQSKRRRR
jgi:16S rRNA (guanine527-N7)-methyltransferase